MWLRHSTASQEILLGPFVDSTDGVTAETGLTIANTDIKIWKEGGTTEASKNSGGATHIASGRYYTVLDATDTDTLGKLEVSVAVSGALPVRRAFVVLPAMVYDSMVLGTDTLQADLTQISGSNVSTSSAQLGVNVVNAAGTAWGSGAITAASIASDAITAAKIADGAIDAATFAADVDAEILSYLVDDATRIDASALNTAATAVGSNGSGLTEAGGTGDQFTAIPWNAAWDAEVESEVTDSLVAHNLDHLCKTATAAADMTTEVADNTILSRILANGDTSVFDPSTDGLQPIRDRGDAAWITATGFSTHSAADVWSVATRVLTAGTNIALAKGTGVTGFNDLDAAGVRSAVGLASANLDTQLGDLPTAAENADAVWDEDATAHQTQGTFGQAIGDPGADTDSIWALANTNLDAAVSTRLASASYTAPPSAATIASAVLTTQMTESYNADGTAPTLAQSLFVVMQRVTEFAISSTTVTVKKLDGSTTAYTLTLDSSSAPTSSTRAT